MSEPTDPDEILKGPAALSAEGRLEQRLERVESAGVPVKQEEPLELVERGPKVYEQRIENYRADLRARSQRPWALKLVIGILLLGVAGFAALLFFKPKLEVPLPDGVRDSTLLDQLMAGGERPPIILNSNPPGATIVIEGQTIGQTPWAGENRWHGQPSLVLRLPGYKPWEGKLQGGKAQTLDIQLKSKVASP